MEKSLIIVRGIPGCGKTSFAELISWFVCTADDYHMVNGKYDWKPENVKTAHLKCQEKCRRLMKIGSSKIAIANTNTTTQEMQPYYDMAKEYGYKVFSVIVENRHGGKNEHNVPEETINKMVERFDIKLT
jgi:predicted kinase